MKKKVLCLLVALTLLTALCIPVCAAEGTYIVDEKDVLYSYEEKDLSDLAADVYEQYGVGVFYGYFSGDVSTIDVNAVVGDIDDYILLAEDDTAWRLYHGGKAEGIIDTAVANDIWSKYEQEVSTKAGVTAYINACEKLIAKELGGEDTDSIAPVITTDGAVTGRLYDGADLLTTDEEANVIQKLNVVSEKHKVDVVIATVESIGDSYIEDFAAAFYDANGYGQNATKDGVLLVVAMAERKYYTLTNGLAHEAITDSEAADIGEEFASYLTDADYVQGFEIFIDQCEYQINGEINGFPFKTGKNLLISLVIGFGLALIVTGIWKGQLKSVRQQKNATTYTRQGSMQISLSNDFFLYSTVSRERKAEKSSSSGSSGSSRGGAGGSF